MSSQDDFVTELMDTGSEPSSKKRKVVELDRHVHFLTKRIDQVLLGILLTKLVALGTFTLEHMAYIKVKEHHCRNLGSRNSS